MKKIILIITVIIFNSCNKVAEYKFIGEFKYVITNKSDFENTYLHDSYGYVVGDKYIPGLKIHGAEKLSNFSNYVIVYNHPVREILIDSEAIRGEGLISKEKPIEVIIDESIKKDRLFIYELDKKYTYRLLQP